MTKERLALAVFALACLIAAARASSEETAAGAPVGILRSPATVRVVGEKAAFDFIQACRLLEDLGVSYTILDEDSLSSDAKGSLVPQCKVVILPGTRCMKAQTTDMLRNHVKGGGKILATYTASYRNENNEKTGDRNDFQLSDIFQVRPLRWVSGKPNAELLAMRPPADERLSILIAGLPSAIQLGRNTAMIVQAEEGTLVIADWQEAGPTVGSKNAKARGGSIGEISPAVIANRERTCIYVGEDLFCAENSQSVEVKKLVAALLNYLDEGLVPPLGPKALRSEPAFFPPMKPHPSPPFEGPIIRVGMNGALQDFHVSSDGDYIIRSGGREVQRPGSSLTRVVIGSGRLVAQDSSGSVITEHFEKIALAPRDPSSFTGLIFLKPNGTFSSRLLRGSVEARRGAKGILLVNSLPLEQYLAGVVPREVPVSYPPEAQKAMAVIARTFALANVGRHGSEGFHLCPTVHCQVFEGVAAEAAASTSAILETAGEVVTFKGAYANTIFHACCAGVGENVERVWKGSKKVPYLAGSFDMAEPPACDMASEKGVREFLTGPCVSFCASSGRFRWQETHGRAEMEGLLKTSLPVLLKDKWRDFGSLLDLEVAERSALGRVSRLRILGTECSHAVEKDAIRWILSGGRIGTGGLNSTLFFIEKEGEGDELAFTFRGGGWGHGVGMCQEGARGRALSGQDYRAIISHYYPGTAIEKIK